VNTVHLEADWLTLYIGAKIYPTASSKLSPTVFRLSTMLRVPVCFSSPYWKNFELSAIRMKSKTYPNYSSPEHETGNGCPRRTAMVGIYRFKPAQRAQIPIKVVLGSSEMSESRLLRLNTWRLTEGGTLIPSIPALWPSGCGHKKDFRSLLNRDIPFRTESIH
jgi:hypothetical protein